MEDQLAVSSPHLSTDDSMIWRENLLTCSQQQFVSPAQERRFKVSAIVSPQKHTKLLSVIPLCSFSITCPELLPKKCGKVDNLDICILLKRTKDFLRLLLTLSELQRKLPQCKISRLMRRWKSDRFVGILRTCQSIHAQLPAHSKFWTGHDNRTNGAMSKLWVTWIHEWLQPWPNECKG